VGDVSAPVERIAHVDLPVPFEPQRADYRREAGAVLGRTNLRRARSRARNREERRADAHADAHDAAVDALEAHPLHDHPDRDRLLREHRARTRVADELADVERQLARRGSGLVRRFDQVLDVLGALGHVDGWSLTRSGERLRRIYHECDLLLSMALDDGVFDGLDAPSCAALASCVTYEHRSAEAPPPPRFPTPELRRRAERLGTLADRLNRRERAARVPETRAPEAGFAESAWRWASGQELHQVLDDDMTGGDFVRNSKQLIDLLRQLGDVAADPRTAATCRSAADALHRGVVEAGSDLG
jgi:ATP-dependent RNA helicase HelY